MKEQDRISWTVQQTLLFPRMLLSGMLLPLEDGPGWLRALADLDPLRHLVDAERALFAGTVADATVLWGALAALGDLAVELGVGIRGMRRAAAQPPVRPPSAGAPARPAPRRRGAGPTTRTAP